MSKIPCEMIRDLFPSYIDGLTSEISNKEIEEHVGDCEECGKILASMKGGGETFAPEEPGDKEIDFLKKNKRRNLKIVLFSILGALALAVLVIALRFFVIGEKPQEGWPYWDVAVDGRELKIKSFYTADSATAVAGVRFEEKDGVVTITARKVLVSFFHTGGYEGTYTAKEEIRQVRSGDLVIWDEGTKISNLAARLFNTCHAYVGDMPANNRTAQVLCLEELFGPYSNELETEEEPYGWKIILKIGVTSEKDNRPGARMMAAATLLMGAIGNLDRVTFSYTVNGVPEELVWTRKQAVTFYRQAAEEDLQDCLESPRAMNALVEWANWSNMVIAVISPQDIEPWRILY